MLVHAVSRSIRGVSRMRNDALLLFALLRVNLSPASIAEQQLSMLALYVYGFQGCSRMFSAGLVVVVARGSPSVLPGGRSKVANNAHEELGREGQPDHESEHEQRERGRVDVYQLDNQLRSND